MKESLLSTQLCLHHVESYYPCLRVKPVNPRSRKTRPYFPGYVFGRLDLEQTNSRTLLWLPGLAGIVSFDGIPSPVPDNLIVAIRRHVDAINATGGDHLECLKPGETVVIRDGPFEGYEAILDARLPDNERVRVLLKLLQARQVSLELPAAQIRKKMKPAERPCFPGRVREDPRQENDNTVVL
jgi:transcriptional antiterminator RfaH